MKKVLLVAAATILASGCASTSSMMQSRDTSMDDVNTSRVAAIDHLARAYGVQVHWINYPQRRSSAPPPAVVDPMLPTGT